MPKGETREGYVLEHPNRDKASSKATKAIVVLLLLVSVALLVIVGLGGWKQMVGAKPLLIAYVLLYLLLAFFIMRWTRGALPVTAALAIIMMIFAIVSVSGWMDRDNSGFAESNIPADVLALLTAIIAPVQLILIAFAMRGFSQEWNVEVERPAHGRDEGERHDGDDGERRSGDAAPQPA